MTRLFLRAPIWLYRLHLGWLLGDRFLMFRHIGRKSGLPRYTVVEVVRHDRATGVYTIASGWGEKSDWFRNISKNPEAFVYTGRGRFPAVAARLPEEEATAALID
ncbi:MAG: nitroreductase family deazaflavin-dependent oxidoreductase, partial [Sphingomonadaceae bacterium]